MTLASVASPSPLWYLTRGSGVAVLVLLTVSICLGVLSSVRWRSERLPRFVVAGLHRNVTLLAVVFLAVHVGTTVLDVYAPINLLDAFVPFVSSYRPLWLGLGALASDLLLAVVLTSLLRVRVGYRVWRVTHWLAYASWPLALVHSLGTGSDARTGWLAALAFVCIGAVALSVLVRILRSAGDVALRGAAGAAAIVLPLAIVIWYRSGPAQPGWAKRAGTPASLLRSTVASTKTVEIAAPSLPRTFDGQLTGQMIEGAPDASGRVTIRVDARVRGGVRGELRLALRGYPTGAGVSMTSSGVALGLRGAPVYEGSIVGLRGSHVSAEVRGAEGAIDLSIDLRIDPRTNAVSGRVSGVRR